MRAQTGKRRSRRARGRLLGFGTAAGILLLAFFGGFVWFLAEVRSGGRPADARADGIVVLTGAGSRIEGALELLSEGRANRLLISGVNPAVSEQALARVIESDKRPYLDCCIDLDRDATDTIGNASSTERWARLRGYQSLIVVTSDYHMPRSLAEMSNIMPDTRLVPYPIADAGPALGRPEVMRLLFEEYLKYLGARLRLLFEPAGAETFDVAGPPAF